MYEYFQCEKINCEGTHYKIYFPRNALVLDSENIQLCKQCNNPISEVRKTLLPKTNICSARCIEEGKIKDDSIFKEHIKPLTIKDKCPRHNEILVERYDRFGGFIHTYTLEN